MSKLIDAKYPEEKDESKRNDLINQVKDDDKPKPSPIKPAERHSLPANPISHTRIKPKEQLSKSVLGDEGNKQTVELINPKTKTKEFAGTLLNGKII